jgi:hypothetical protein
VFNRREGNTGQSEKEQGLFKKLTIVALVLGVAGGTSVPALATGSVAVPANGSVAAPATPDGLDVLPFPGTPDASPVTQISFPGVPLSALGSVAVTGSRSGPHLGRLSSLAGGHGSTFAPAQPFIGGEQVSVRATLRAGMYRTAPASSAATQLRFSFGIAVMPAPAPAPLIRHDVRDANGFTRTFHSAPGLHAPVVSTSGSNPDPAAGDIFADAENSISAGPLIFSPNGNLVWFEPMHHSAAFNVEVQHYQGQSVLTFWQGYVIPPGYGVGTGEILDHHYQTIAHVNAGNGYHADLHEFQITPQGNALITIYQPVKADLRSVGGSRTGMLLDSIVQEVNIASGQVLWEWHAYGHAPLIMSYAGKPTNAPYDFFHVNSIQQLPDGSLLISARHTWTVYDISMRTGRVLWRVGGKRSSFKVGSGANFEWQHDAHLQGKTLTVFDNAAGLGHGNEKQSRGLQIRLNFGARTATLARAYPDKPSVLSSSQGSVESLSDGNTFVGYGNSPYFAEFGQSGRQLFGLHFNSPLESYRGYRFQWWGQPTTPPSIAVSPSGPGANVWASWNGATAVASWVLLAGSSPTTLQPVLELPDSNFETTLATANPGPYYEVDALDSSGRSLATSATVKR